MHGGGTSFSMKYFSVEFQGKALEGGCTGGGSFSMKYFCVEIQGKALGGGCTGGEFFDEIFLRRNSREGSQRWMHGGGIFR